MFVNSTMEVLNYSFSLGYFTSTFPQHVALVPFTSANIVVQLHTFFTESGPCVALCPECCFENTLMELCSV